MTVTYTAFSNNSILNIYKPPTADSFNPNSLVVTRSSNSQVVFEASHQGAKIRAELNGVFGAVAAIGSTPTELINSGISAIISSEDLYVNNVLFETIRYSSPVNAADSYGAGLDATSSLYRKIYAGNDIFIASAVLKDAENDNVAGYGGNDVFYGFGDDGSDFFDGGPGIDTSVYRGAFVNYEITKANDIRNPNTDRNDLSGIQVKDKTGLDGTDKLINVERLKFSDISLALDVGSSQNAGSVYMLYKAAFNRPSDAGGMGFWISLKDGGADIVTNIAQGFVNSAEFIGKYGANPSNSSYVNNLYQNVLGRAGEAGGVAYWTGEMDAGRVSKAQALVQFATLPEGAGIVAPLIANGIQYQEWVG